jgi:hypothetical protein
LPLLTVPEVAQLRVDASQVHGFHFLLLIGLIAATIQPTNAFGHSQTSFALVLLSARKPLACYLRLSVAKFSPHSLRCDALSQVVQCAVAVFVGLREVVGRQRVLSSIV